MSWENQHHIDTHLYQVYFTSQKFCKQVDYTIMASDQMEAMKLGKIWIEQYNKSHKGDYKVLKAIPLQNQ